MNQDRPGESGEMRVVSGAKPHMGVSPEGRDPRAII